MLKLFDIQSMWSDRTYFLSQKRIWIHGNKKKQRPKGNAAIRKFFRYHCRENIAERTTENKYSKPHRVLIANFYLIIFF